MLREPAVAGAFYPDNPEDLKVAIEDSFLSPFGIGKIPEDVKKFEGKDYPINIIAPPSMTNTIVNSEKILFQD